MLVLVLVLALALALVLVLVLVLVLRTLGVQVVLRLLPLWRLVKPESWWHAWPSKPTSHLHSPLAKQEPWPLHPESHSIRRPRPRETFTRSHEAPSVPPSHTQAPLSQYPCPEQFESDSAHSNEGVAQPGPPKPSNGKGTGVETRRRVRTV